MYSIQRLVDNYLMEKISYHEAVKMLKVYLNHKNISRATFDKTIELLEGFELTKYVESGE